jgi:outer membrane protein TolC
MKKAERIVTLARTVLNNCIGYSEDVNPVTPLFVVKEIQPLAYFQKSAIDNNPLLFQIAANRELAHQGYLKEIASFSPEIFAFGTKEIYGYKVPEYVPNWVVGIGATCTIFEGFAGSEKVKAARAQEERVAVLESKARKDILMLVEKNYQELMQALEQYEALITAYEFTQEYLRVREKAFAEGSATSLDVVDAELAFAKVKIDKLKAAYDFDVALASLLETSGISAQFEQYMKGTEEVEF